MTPSIVIIVHTIGPYHDARLRAAARLMPVHAIELARRSDTYSWQKVESDGSYERTTVGGGRRFRDVLSQAIRKKDAVVAIPGWSRPEALRAFAVCARAGVPTVLLSESQAQDATRDPLREGVKRFVVRSADAGFVGGLQHARYLRSLGMPTSRITRGYDAVDNAFFTKEAASCRERAEPLRASLGLSARFILSCARFVPKKNLQTLVEAFAIFKRRGHNAWSLVLVGDGEERGPIEEAIHRFGVVGNVLLPGFRQIGELPSYYALADVFVLPSLVEPWGLVVNEAMACGLPVIVSNRAGCAHELVHPEHGRIVDPTSPGQIADALEEILRDEEIRRRMGEAAGHHVRRWGTRRFAWGLRRAAGIASKTNRGTGPARAALLDLVASMRSRQS